jgi:hypothetical protein
MVDIVLHVSTADFKSQRKNGMVKEMLALAIFAGPRNG